MRTTLLLSALSFVLFSATAAPIPKNVRSEPEARIEFLTTSLKDGDPLVMAVSLTNYSKSTLTLKRRLNFSEGDIVFEVRSDDEKKFRAVTVSCQRYKTSKCYLGKIEIPEHSLAFRECERLHTVLPLDDQTDLPRGKCFIRVRVKTKAEDVVSEEYEFHISERPARSAEALAEFDPIHYWVPLYPASHAEATKLSKALQNLEGSAAGTVLRNRLLAHDAKEAKPGTELDKLLASIAEQKKTMTPLEHEVLDLVVCNGLLQRQKVKAAEMILSKIKEPSVERERQYRDLNEMKQYVK